jgi:hypothetical protein
MRFGQNESQWFEFLRAIPVPRFLKRLFLYFAKDITVNDFIGRDAFFNGLNDRGSKWFKPPKVSGMLLIKLTSIQLNY